MSKRRLTAVGEGANIPGAVPGYPSGYHDPGDETEGADPFDEAADEGPLDPMPDYKPGRFDVRMMSLAEVEAEVERLDRRRKVLLKVRKLLLELDESK